MAFLIIDFFFILHFSIFLSFSFFLDLSPFTVMFLMVFTIIFSFFQVSSFLFFIYCRIFSVLLFSIHKPSIHDILFLSVFKLLSTIILFRSRILLCVFSFFQLSHIHFSFTFRFFFLSQHFFRLFYLDHPHCFLSIFVFYFILL